MQCQRDAFAEELAGSVDLAGHCHHGDGQHLGHHGRESGKEAAECHKLLPDVTGYNRHAAGSAGHAGRHGDHTFQ